MGPQNQRFQLKNRWGGGGVWQWDQSTLLPGRTSSIFVVMLSLPYPVQALKSPGGALHPETGRGEGSAGWIFTPTGVSAEWILTPTGVSNFHKNDPQRVAKYENFTNITPKEWLKMKKMIPNRSMFDIWIPNQSVYQR